MATLIKIGNSQGLRIPKAIIEQARLGGKELEFSVTAEGLLVRPVTQPRQGWKEQFERISVPSGQESDQEWLEAPLANDEEWEW
jgi:antitoxin MazE